MDRVISLKQEAEGKIQPAARSPQTKVSVENPIPIPLACLLSPSSVPNPRHRRPQRSASCDHFDRFIPKRNNDFASEIVQFKISHKDNMIAGPSEASGGQVKQSAYKQNKDRAIYLEKMHHLCGKPIESKLFEFKTQKYSADYRDTGDTGNARGLLKDCLLYRKLPEKPEQIFDVSPCVPFDEPMSTNLIAYGLEEAFVLSMRKSVFVLSFKPGREHNYKCLAKYSVGNACLNEFCSSVLWFDEGNRIALGSNLGTIQIYDARVFRKIGELSCDYARVNCLAWNQQSKVFCSGDGEGNIRHFDLRSPRSEIRHFSAFGDHTSLSEVHFSPDGQYLAAGGTRTTFGVWRATDPKCYFKHETGSKRKFSVSWCPWKHSSLATGGCLTESARSSRISLWNIHSGAEINHVNTITKINKIIWNGRTKELVSGHCCYPKSLQVWKYHGSDFQLVGEIMGQYHKVADMAFNADQSILGTITKSDKLQLWHYYEKKRQNMRSWASLTALNQVIR